MSATLPTRPRWLFGPGSDLLLGCGGAYFVVFLLIAVIGASMTQLVPMWVMLLVLLFTAVPHYGATLVRAYGRREDRQRYRLFTVWLAIAVWSGFVASVYDARLGSWFLTLNLTWSPWHYSGQNYGIGLMLLRRRNVAIPDLAKRLLYASFLLSWLLVVLGTHSEAGSVSYSPTPVSVTDTAFVFIPLGIPLWVVGPGILIVGFAYVASLIGAFVLLRRKGASLRDLSPMLSVILLQAMWFSLPVLFRLSGSFQGLMPFSMSAQAYVLQWMALAHSLQYLWVSTYYATSSKQEPRRTAYWLKIYLAGATTFAIPVFLFSPDLLGVYAFDEGLGLLIASAVNLHHFLLDGAIWKLRDGRIARVLLRTPKEAAAGAPESLGEPGRLGAWMRPLLVVSGIGYGLFTIVGTWELEWGFRRPLERHDVARLETASRRMSWVGRGNFALHYDLGVLALREGDLETAEREVARSLELAPKPEAWVTLGRIQLRGKRFQEALESFTRGLELDPGNVPALSLSARAWMQLGQPQRAAEALRQAIERAPERQDLRARLQRLSAMQPHADRSGS